MHSPFMPSYLLPIPPVRHLRVPDIRQSCQMRAVGLNCIQVNRPAAAARKREMLAVGRPGGILVAARAAGHLKSVCAVGLGREDFELAAGHALVRDLVPFWGPRRRVLVST